MLSAVLITKNEEELLGRCLDTLKGIDEIIITDTGSTDSTKQIASKYTDKIYDFPWVDSFCKARNFANSKATGDFILTIDADEELLTPIDTIKDILRKTDKQVLNVNLEDGKGGSHKFPRLFKNSPEIFWKGDIHNYLNKTAQQDTEIRIRYGYSPAHKKDPDRALRILTKVVNKNPTATRERYYLAREYYYREKWQECVDHLDMYLKVAKWRPEIADAYLMRARGLWQLQRGEEARVSCMYAIMTNPDFKEALVFMAEMNYEPRKSKWLGYSNLAQNKDVLFVREGQEKDSGYYNELFKRDTDMSRYEAIYKKIQELVGDKSVLDIGCGLAQLSEFIPNYSGFDFSEYAIGQIKDKDVWVGNAYESKNYKDRDVYVCSEVLEHVDDLKVLENIKKGQRFIFSVPSFKDPSHLRTYTKETLNRLPIDIKEVYRFNWKDKKWVLGGKDTNSYILLVDCYKV